MKLSIVGLLSQAILLFHLVCANPEAEYEGNTNLRLLKIRSEGNVLSARAHAPLPHRVKQLRTDADIAHGVLMGLAVALFLPLGALTTRLVKNRHMLWIHVASQAVGMILFIGGFATGVWTCIIHDEIFTDPHTSFGTAIMGLFLLQPVFGWLHHVYFVKKGGRTIWTHVHVWFGRAILILAIVNGGLGIQYAENAVKGEIGFGVISGVVGLFYVAVLVWWYLRPGSSKVKEEFEQREGSYGLGEAEKSRIY